MNEEQIEFILEPVDNGRLANLCGHLDSHLQQIEERLAVAISYRGAQFVARGAAGKLAAVQNLLEALYAETAHNLITSNDVHLALQAANLDLLQAGKMAEVMVRTKRKFIKVRGANQADYVSGIEKNDLCFGVGPAGTGKTYLAIASAVAALESDSVRRIVLVRPAVEAGEKLGFLPGDLAQKVDPYLRPMYDALYEMLGYDKVAKLMERHVIEVAPLAYMRGRTLNEAFIVMDEAQNTTVEQMKMFLTRIGFGSKTVVTGDLTQTDLPNKASSGLAHALEILAGIQSIHVTHFISADVVRHPLVKRIVDAYARAEK